MIDRRNLVRNTLAAGALLPFLSPSQLLAQDSDAAFLAMVHPDLRKAAKAILQMTKSMPAYTRETLPQIRKGAGSYVQKPAANVPFEQRTLPGRAGQPDVPVYIINAKAGASRPVIVDTHGGGFITGSAATDLPSLQDICKTLDCAAISVEYRLAPETTYAGSIEDNYTALKWVHDHVTELGADPARIAVMGGSAGGGHAAMLAIAARDRGEVPIAFQCLIYPMLDDRTGSSRPVPPHVGRLIWNAASNRYGWESFLGMKPGGRAAPKGAVPARVENLAGLPPAFIGVGTLDLFHDEDVEYARRLNDAGVSTELIVVPGAFHGFDMMSLFDPGARIARWFNEAKINALRAGLGLAPA